MHHSPRTNKAFEVKVGCALLRKGLEGGRPTKQKRCARGLSDEMVGPLRAEEDSGWTMEGQRKEARRQSGEVGLARQWERDRSRWPRGWSAPGGMQGQM